MLDPISSAVEPLVFDPPVSPPQIDSPSAAAHPFAVKTAPVDLAALFESEESGLLRFAIGLVGRRSVAEELVQEAFLRLHRGRDGVEKPKAWLYRCVHNLALNHLRDRPIEAELDEKAVPGIEAFPVEALGRNEAVGMVRLLLAEMPPEDRTLIQLKYHDGLRYREISKRTGLSVGNVGYRLHHVLKGLADSLRHAGIEGSQG
jgi:RNA polymerase sigma-70 factor (ECF subfamily)